MPIIGGFSLASLPRPRSPFRRRLRGRRPFFYRLEMTLMSCHHIDFVRLVLSLQHDRRAAVDDPLSEFLDHGPSIIFVDVEFLSDLQSREVQPHKIEAGDPDSQRQVMTGEDGIGQVVESLAERLGVVPTVLDDRVRRVLGTGHAVRPSHVSDRVEALCVVEEILDVDHATTPGCREVVISGADALSNRRDRL